MALDGCDNGSMKWAALLLSLLAISSCATPGPRTEATTSAIDRSKLVDLTYTFDDKTIYWPNAEGFRHRKDVWKRTDAGYWYAAGEFTTAAHGGTHFDAPIHFAEGKLSLDQIPVQKLIAPAVVIDISGKASA